MIDLETLEQWQRTTDAASDGPWKADTEELGDAVVWGGRQQELIANVGAPFSRVVLDRADAEPEELVVFDLEAANAKFVALARTAMPQLLAELRRLYREVHDARHALDDQVQAAREELDEIDSIARHELPIPPHAPPTPRPKDDDDG